MHDHSIFDERRLVAALIDVLTIALLDIEEKRPTQLCDTLNVFSAAVGARDAGKFYEALTAALGATPALLSAMTKERVLDALRDERFGEVMWKFLGAAIDVLTGMFAIHAEFEDEHVPTREEIAAIFTRAVGPEYRQFREKSDKLGLAVWEVEVDDKDPGESIRMCYTRKGDHGTDQSLKTVIHKAFLVGKDVVGGKPYATLIDGEWVFA